jgi:hypothetical protein
MKILDDAEIRCSLFAKALHMLLRMNEGVALKYEDHWYLVHKYQDKEGELVSVMEREDFADNPDIHDYQILWLHDDVSEIN